MAKTVPPGTIVIPQVGAFSADALPDPFDERDLEYRPRLEPLPVVLDQRQGTDERYVMRQDGNSCTGHALAAAINAVLARPAPAADDGPAREPYPHVSRFSRIPSPTWMTRPSSRRRASGRWARSIVSTPTALTTCSQPSAS